MSAFQVVPFVKESNKHAKRQSLRFTGFTQVVMIICEVTEGKALQAGSSNSKASGAGVIAPLAALIAVVAMQ